MDLPSINFSSNSLKFSNRRSQNFQFFAVFLAQDFSHFLQNSKSGAESLLSGFKEVEEDGKGRKDAHVWLKLKRNRGNTP